MTSKSTMETSSLHSFFFSAEEEQHEQHDETMGLIQVSTPLLLASAAPLLCIGMLSRVMDLGLDVTIAVSTGRAFVQLTVLGIVLNPIFRVGMEVWWVVILYVLVMIIVAANVSVGRPKYRFRHQTLMIFVTMLISTSAVSLFAFFVIIRPSPRWNPRYVIPIVGMLLGNCINGIALAMTDLSASFVEQKREIELYLCFGGTGWEASRRFIRKAVRTGVTPMLNMMNVIGIVSIPGMMTGQILGGASVSDAARYQILIIYLISICAFGMIFMTTRIIYWVAFYDANVTHSSVLRTDRFVEVKKNKGQPGDFIINFVKRLVKNVIFFEWSRGKNRLDDATNVTTKQSSAVAGTGPTDVGGDLESSYLLGVQQSPDGGAPPPTRPHGNYDIILDAPAKHPIQISSKQRGIANGTTASTPSSPSVEHDSFFCVRNLQFSIPKGHTKQDAPPPPAHVLCKNFDVSLTKGEIATCSGKSGSGKSTLLRVLAGLHRMDQGDVIFTGTSLADCFGIGTGAGAGDENGGAEGKRTTDMTRWRRMVRYATQYKVDIPGTPNDFIARVTSFRSFRDGISRSVGGDAPSMEEMLATTRELIELWGMNGLSMDKEWTALSGGESQRVFMAIVLASRPKILLLDEITSGMDSATELKVEKSIKDYASRYGASVLWVTHNDNMITRLTK